MWILMAIFGASVLITGTVTYFQRRGKTENVLPQLVVERDAECCGAHAVCIKKLLLNSSSKIEYFDDEELDGLAGVNPVDYTASQRQMLADVFNTMQKTDVPAWLHSLKKRKIELTDEIKEKCF